MKKALILHLDRNDLFENLFELCFDIEFKNNFAYRELVKNLLNVFFTDINIFESCIENPFESIVDIEKFYNFFMLVPKRIIPKLSLYSSKISLDMIKDFVLDGINFNDEFFLLTTGLQYFKSIEGLEAERWVSFLLENSYTNLITYLSNVLEDEKFFELFYHNALKKYGECTY